MSDSHDEYDVGYGKPPKSGQFKKGQSGNPSGKKAPLSVEESLKRALGKKIVVTVDGQKQKLSMLEVMIQTLVRKAAGGDMSAIKTVIAARMAMPDEPIQEVGINDHDLALLKDILAQTEAVDHE